MRRILSAFLWWAPRLFLIVGGLAAVNLVWFFPALQSTRASASILALEIADRFRTSTIGFLDSGLNELNQAADAVGFDPPTAGQILNRLLKHNPGFRDVALVDRSGKETLRIDRFRLVRKGDLGNHRGTPYFHLALDGNPNFGDVFITPEGEPPITLAVQVLGIASQ